MIENERQYRITRAWVEKFAESARHMAEAGAAGDPLIQEAMVAQYQSQLEEFRRDLEDYDALRSGRVASLEVESLTALPEALIRARIAAGLTQKELGARLGLKEQQVQRYESTRYSGVSLERAQAVMDALGVRIHEHLTLSRPEQAS
jgi:ribosome-binding protein aMBF1 (putative translation factor)